MDNRTMGEDLVHGLWGKDFEYNLELEVGAARAPVVDYMSRRGRTGISMAVARLRSRSRNNCATGCRFSSSSNSVHFHRTRYLG